MCFASCCFGYPFSFAEQSPRCVRGEQLLGQDAGRGELLDRPGELQRLRPLHAGVFHGEEALLRLLLLLLLLLLLRLRLTHKLPRTKTQKRRPKSREPTKPVDVFFFFRRFLPPKSCCLYSRLGLSSSAEGWTFFVVRSAFCLSSVCLSLSVLVSVGGFVPRWFLLVCGVL